MTFGVGVALFVIGFALMFIARERTDGTSILRVSGNMLMIYVPVCVAFIAFGVAFMISGW